MAVKEGDAIAIRSHTQPRKTLQAAHRAVQHIKIRVNGPIRLNPNQPVGLAIRAIKKQKATAGEGLN